MQGVPDTGSPRSPAITGINWATAGSTSQLPQAGDPPSTSYRISRHDLENFLFQKMVRVPAQLSLPKCWQLDSMIRLMH
jgi:hypothetical protein